MSLEERVYSVLVVSASESFNKALTSLASDFKFHPLHFVSSISIANRYMAERSYDFILINSPLPDDTGIRFAINITTKNQAAVLLLVRSDVHEEVYDEVTEYGVFTLPKPTSRQILAQGLRWMASARERLRYYENNSLSLEQKMEEIRIVNRAKLLLISELKMSEPEAHRYIEKQAMDMCISKRKIAEDVIKMYS